MEGYKRLKLQGYIEYFLRWKIANLQGCKVSKLYGSMIQVWKISRMQSLKASKLESCKALQGCNGQRLEDLKVSILLSIYNNDSFVYVESL